MLRVESLREAYGDQVVLRDVSLEVAPHDVVCLIGASGDGKSAAAGPEPSRAPSTTAYHLFPHMSVLETLTLAPRTVHGIDRAETGAREMLGRFRPADKADDHSDRLSGGQQQRAALVWALVANPSPVLLDEVTSAVDPELVTEVLDILRDLAAGGTTMVLATHEMAFAPEVATAVCFLQDGAVLEQGRPEAMLSDPRHERTRPSLRGVPLDTHTP